MAESIDDDQYKIVTDLLSRQDEVLEQLDQLNSRVEAAIVEVNAFRSVDEAEEATELQEIDQNQHQRAA